jgi:hypothetical protein
MHDTYPVYLVSLNIMPLHAEEYKPGYVVFPPPPRPTFPFLDPDILLNALNKTTAEVITV